MSDLADRTALRLETYSNDPRFASRSEDLLSLARELRSDDSLEPSWGGVDLFQAFSLDSVTAFRHHNFLERALGVLAAMSVFFPVAWTWLSFSRATNAYADLLSTNSDVGDTFLALWADGFDGRLPTYHQLVTSTFISFLLILLAMVFIVVHRLAAGTNSRQEDREAAQAYQELVSVLTPANRVLQARQVSDPAQLDTLVKKSLRNLLRAHKSIDVSAGELKNATVEFSQALTPVLSALQSATNDSLAASEAIKETSDGVAASVTLLHEQLDKIATVVDSMRTDTQDSMTGLAQTIEQLDSSFAGSASALQAQTSELTNARDAAERLLLHLESRLSQNGTR